jgi:hypothetical protein
VRVTGGRRPSGDWRRERMLYRSGEEYARLVRRHNQVQLWLQLVRLQNKVRAQAQVGHAVVQRLEAVQEACSHAVHAPEHIPRAQAAMRLLHKTLGAHEPCAPVKVGCQTGARGATEAADGTRRTAGSPAGTPYIFFDEKMQVGGASVGLVEVRGSSERGWCCEGRRGAEGRSGGLDGTARAGSARGIGGGIGKERAAAPLGAGNSRGDCSSWRLRSAVCSQSCLGSRLTRWLICHTTHTVEVYRRAMHLGQTTHYHRGHSCTKMRPR